MTAKAVQASQALIRKEDPAPTYPSLQSVFPWIGLSRDEQFAVGTVLRRGGKEDGYQYRVVIENINGIMEFYCPDETSETIFSEAILGKKQIKDWVRYRGDDVPDLHAVSGHSDKVELALVIFLKGRAGCYSEEEEAAIEKIIGNPALDNKPGEPHWRKIARSMWLPPDATMVDTLLRIML